MDISHKPHIEDATAAIQMLYREMHTIEGIMIFVEEDDTYWDNENDKLMFVEQVDSDIEKYKLFNIIRKHENDCLYTVYGDFMSAFTSSQDFFS